MFLSSCHASAWNKENSEHDSKSQSGIFFWGSLDLHARIPLPKDAVLGDSHILPLLNSAVEERLFIKPKALPAVEKEFITPTLR